MQEILEKRSYNAKHFDKGDGQFVMEAHAGHIHYKDKMGDSTFKDIDWALSWNEVKRGWYFNSHSFRPFLPEYADEWVEFRDLFDDKDQTIKYKAVASHVQGRLVNPADIGLKGTSVNCVIYDNAFGEGFDYILYFTRSTLKKVVRIRDGYKPNADVSFDFEVEFPNGKAVKRGYPVKNIAYELDKTTSKRFDTDKQTLIGNDQNDGKEWNTYLRGFIVWDDEKSATIAVDYIVENGKTYLRKNITKDFLDGSVGDVFTDTTTSYYSGAQDGDVDCVNSVWADVVSATTGASFALTNGMREQASHPSGYLVVRGFCPINTSDLPDTTIISDVKLYICPSAVSGSNGVNIWQGTQADSLGIADFDAFSGSAVATAVTSWTVDTVTYLTFSDFSPISKTGTTKLCLRIDKDYDNSAPTSNNYVFLYGSENTGTDKDPYLSVTYSAASSFIPKTMIL